MEERSKTWLNSHKNTLLLIKLSNKEQEERINNLLLEIEMLLIKYDKDTFKNTFGNILQLYSEIVDFKENELHTLYNLALVNVDTNSVLK